VSKTTGLNNTTVLSRSGVVLGLNKSITIKKKNDREHKKEDLAKIETAFALVYDKEEE
jgi:hypothetical protein